MTNGRPTPDDLISAYHDGELSAADRQVADRLLEESADLRTELEDYRALTELLQSVPRDDVPAGLRAEVMERIEQNARPAAPVAVAASSTSRLSRKRLFGLIAGGLTAAVGVLVALTIFDGPNASRDRTLARAPAPDVASPFGTTSGRAVEANADEHLHFDMAATDLAETDLTTAAGAQASLHNSIRELQDMPDGIGIGEVVRYLEQTADGDVLVVEATVVDVRTAMNELQVLLTKNSIPTLPVDFAEDGSARTAAKESTSELAVYVESDPIQLNNALTELGRQTAQPQQFVEFELAGVLNSPANVKLSRDESAGRPASTDGFARSRMARGALGGSVGQGTEAERKEIVPQSRFSIPAESSLGLQPAPTDAPAGAEAPKDASLPALAPAVPQPTPARRSETLNETQAAPAAPDHKFRMADERLEPTTETYGYQTVVNFSKEDLRKQLQTSGAGKSESAPRQDSYFADPDVEREAAASPPDVQLELRQDAQQARRKLRLLVVLEAQGDPSKLKASASPPVEAPRPAKKKG